MTAYTRRSRHWKMATLTSAPVGPATITLFMFKNDHRDRFMFLCGQIGANLNLSSLFSVFQGSNGGLGGSLASFGESIGEAEEAIGTAGNVGGLVSQGAQAAGNQREWTELSVLIPFAARDLNGATLGTGSASFGVGVGVTGQSGYISGQIETRNAQGRTIDFGVERFCVIPASHSLGLATPGVSMIGGPLVHLTTHEGPHVPRIPAAATGDAASGRATAQQTATPATATPPPRPPLPARTGIIPPSPMARR